MRLPIIVVILIIIIIIALVFIPVVHPSRRKTPVRGHNSPWGVNIPPGGASHPCTFTPFAVVFFSGGAEASHVALLLLLQVGHTARRRGGCHVGVAGGGGWSTVAALVVRGVGAGIAH